MVSLWCPLKPSKRSSIDDLKLEKPLQMADSPFAIQEENHSLLWWQCSPGWPELLPEPNPAAARSTGSPGKVSVVVQQT